MVALSRICLVQRTWSGLAATIALALVLQYCALGGGASSDRLWRAAATAAAKAEYAAAATAAFRDHLLFDESRRQHAHHSSSSSSSVVDSDDDEDLNHQLRRTQRPPPTFQSHDTHTLSRVLDCGDSCVYVGLEAKDEEKEEEKGKQEGGGKASNGPTVPVRKLSRKMHCPTSWLRLLSSCPAGEWPPPKNVPEELQGAFTMGGRAAVSEWYFSQRYSGSDAFHSHWTASDLSTRIASASLDDAMGGIRTYGMNETRYMDHAIARHAKGSIADGVGVVWGSELPWVEVLLARHGAKRVVTVEYGRIKVDEHPVISATTPSQFAAMMLTHPRSFDFAVTYSSLEHSGLGRYGDPLNPYGDIEAAVQTWCLLRPGGIFLLGLPAEDPSSSLDTLVWNAHRHYGPLRLAEMFAGYEFVETVDWREFGAGVHAASMIHVLRKPMTPDAS
jgi:hypothetical protein